MTLRNLLVLLAIATIAVVGSALSTRAVAQTTRTATCVWRIPGAPTTTIGTESTGDKANAATQAWMSSQLAAGATSFVLVPMTGSTTYASLCAY